jgi:hypothetical protein
MEAHRRTVEYLSATVTTRLLCLQYSGGCLLDSSKWLRAAEEETLFLEEDAEDDNGQGYDII